MQEETVINFYFIYTIYLYPTMRYKASLAIVLVLSISCCCFFAQAPHLLFEGKNNTRKRSTKRDVLMVALTKRVSFDLS